MRLTYCDPSSPEFSELLSVFLAHTDEYEYLIPFYLGFLKNLKEHKHYLDIGPGDGSSLSKHTDMYFDSGIGLEPNRSLHKLLTDNCPRMKIVAQPFRLGISNELPALFRDCFDLVQAVHCLYYVPEPDRLPLINEMLSLLRIGGKAFIVLQDENSDLSKMYAHFLSYKYGLKSIFNQLKNKHSEFKTTMEVVQGTIRCQKKDNVRGIIRFMLSYIPSKQMPLVEDIDKYISERFWAEEEAQFVINNPQKILIIERLPSVV